jgi:alpha-glucosidase
MGLFFRGSNAMSPVIRYTEDDKALLSYISTGGQVEIYFIMKGSAKDVIKRYQNLVGKPSLPPLWSLGWQMGGTAFESQSDYFDLIGYHDISRYPLETVWID